MKRKLIIILTAIMLLNFVQIGTISLQAQASTVASSFSASASSYYTQNRTSVAPSCAIDENEYSSWDSYGEYEGAWLELTSKNGVVAISGFRIENGKCKSRDYGDTYYYKNARIKSFSIYVDGARVYNGELKDTNRWQEVDFGQAFAGTKFRLRVDSIYAGTGTPKNNFGVCITEIEPVVVKVKPAPTQTPLPTPTAVPTVKPVETPTVTATVAPAIVLDPESVIVDTDIAVLSCPIPDTKVYDRDSAVLALETLKEAIGFDNIGEFSEPKERIAPVTASFSFEQYIDSIPVEGSEVRLITNRQGDVINVLNTYVDPKRVLRGNVGAPEAYDTVAAIEGTDAIVNLGKVICATTGGDVHECYKLVTGNAGATYYYVSTFSGEVVLCYSAALNDYAIGHGNSMRVNDGNGAKTFTTQYRNKLYYLEDYDRRIRVYDMNGFDVDAVFNDDRKDYEKHKEDLKAYYIVREHIDSQDYYVYDLDSPPYRSGVNLLKNNAVDSKHFYTLSTDGMTVYDNDRVLFTNPYREILWGKKSFLYSLNKEYELFKLASDKDNNWESESAVTAYLSLIDIMDFWNASLHRDGFDDTERSVVNVYVNAAIDNAFSFSDNCGRGVLFSNIVIGNPYDGKYDVLGHEFNHSVISSFCDLGKGYVYAEAAALNEGLSDIMGELCEDYTFGTCDWNNGRNLKDPKQSGNPEKCRGNGWITHDDEAYKILVMNEPESVKPRDKGHYDIYGHRNSTVIGHMGYLMATGEIAGAVNIEPLGTQKLAELIYSSYNYLSYNISMNRYVSYLYQTAIEMYKAGDLSDKQVRCVYEAINKVGLLITFFMHDANADRFCDLDDEVLDRYSYEATVESSRSIKLDRISGRVIQGQVTASFDGESNEVLPAPLSRQAGGSVLDCYLATFTNLSNTDETFRCLIYLWPDLPEKRINVPFIAAGNPIPELIVSADGPYHTSGGYDYYYTVHAIDENGKHMLDSNGSMTLFSISGADIDIGRFRVWKHGEDRVFIEFAQAFSDTWSTQMTLALYRLNQNNDFICEKKASIEGWSVRDRVDSYDNNVTLYEFDKKVGTIDYSQEAWPQIAEFFSSEGIEFNKSFTLSAKGWGTNGMSAFTYKLANDKNGSLVYDSEYDRAKLMRRSEVERLYYVPMEVQQPSEEEQGITVLLHELEQEFGALNRTSSHKSDNGDYQESFKSGNNFIITINATAQGKVTSIRFNDSDYYNYDFRRSATRFTPSEYMRRFYQLVCASNAFDLKPETREMLSAYDYDASATIRNTDIVMPNRLKSSESIVAGIKITYRKSNDYAAGDWTSSELIIEFPKD